MSEGTRINLPAPGDNSLFATNGARLVHRQSNTKELSIEKVAQDFESFLIFTMMKEMEKTTCGSKKSYAEQTYMALMHEKVADYLSKRGLGVKDMLVKYMGDRNIKVFKEKGDNVGK